MKKIIIFLSTALFLLASNNKYLNYTDKLVHYHFELKNFNKIKAPFKEKRVIKGAQKIKTSTGLEKSIKIKLLSVFNKSAYILIRVYLGEAVIKSYKKWVKVGETIEKNYKVKKITLNKIILRYKNKIIIKTLNKQIPGMKEK